jgi:hypothetical protein
MQTHKGPGHRKGQLKGAMERLAGFGLGRVRRRSWERHLPGFKRIGSSSNGLVRVIALRRRDAPLFNQQAGPPSKHQILSQPSILAVNERDPMQFAGNAWCCTRAVLVEQIPAICGQVRREDVARFECGNRDRETHDRQL